MPSCCGLSVYYGAMMDWVEGGISKSHSIYGGLKGTEGR